MYKIAASLLLVISITGRGLCQETQQASASFAIVELFTAEGCSSCPAADALLGEMTGILKKEGKNILPLSFHVDYWNNYGWVDPYSNETFTNRQKKYMSVLNLPQLYTPQAIVNGEYEFTGSNPFAFRENCLHACSEVTEYAIDAGMQLENNKIHLRYALNKLPRHAVLNIALAEDHVERFIAAGENKNKTLQHTNVVRSFTTIEPAAKGEYSMDVPSNFDVNGFSLIVYLQDQKSMKIIAAQSVKIKP